MHGDCRVGTIIGQIVGGGQVDAISVCNVEVVDCHRPTVLGDRAGERNAIRRAVAAQVNFHISTMGYAGAKGQTVRTSPAHVRDLPVSPGERPSSQGIGAACVHVEVGIATFGQL